MALQGDGNGIVTIPLAEATGDFSLVFSDLEITDPANAEVIIGIFSANNNFVATFAGAVLYSRIAGGNINGQYSGAAGQHVKYEVKRVGAVLSHLVDDVEIGSANSSGTFRLDTFFSYNNGVFKYTGLLTGTCSFVGFTSSNQVGTPDRLYDFEGSGSTLVDTISGEDGTLSGFTTGGFTSSSTGITITSVSDFESKEWDANEQAIFTIGGEVTGTPISEILYSFDNVNFQTLKATPTFGSYSVDITVTRQQTVYVKSADDDNVNASVSSLTAGLTLGGAPQQSNGVARIINAQTISITGGNPIPVMYKAGVFSELEDPTGVDWNGSNDGSWWVGIAQKLSDLGIPVCIANMAEGGTSIQQWEKGGTLYSRIEQFYNSVGGISLLVSLIGETDSSAGTGTALFKSRYLGVAADIQADFNCDIYATYFPVGTGTGTTEHVDEIRLAYDQIIAETSYVHFGGDLSVIDISSTTDPANDNLHIKTDAAASEAVEIIWSELPFGISSTLSIIDSDTPDGIYSGKVYNDDIDEIIGVFDFTFVGGDCDLILPINASTNIHYLVPGSNPPTTGIADIGVTV